MTRSTKVEMHVTYIHDPKVMGFTYISAILRRSGEAAAGMQVFSWNTENGVMSRSQLVDTVVRLIQDRKPSRVGFRAAQPEQLSDDYALSDKFVYWSPETLRAVIEGTRTAADLLVA